MCVCVCVLGRVCARELMSCGKLKSFSKWEQYSLIGGEKTNSPVFTRLSRSHKSDISTIFRPTSDVVQLEYTNAHDGAVSVVARDLT